MSSMFMKWRRSESKRGITHTLMINHRKFLPVFGRRRTELWQQRWQSSLRWLCAILLTGGVAFGAVPERPAGETAQPAIYRKGQTRIMPLGDSITHGGSAGWRIHLQDLLRNAGYTFRMVGGRNDPHMSDDYWSAHGGSGGWVIGSFPRSEEFGGADVDWIGSQPDLVLLEIGTNDAQWGDGRGAPERLSSLLDRIWKDLPNCIIIVAQITPFAPGGRVNDKPDGAQLDPVVREYNAAIPGLVASKVAAGKRAAVVDLYTRFDPTQHLADKCHPNQAGHRQLAQLWFEAIQKITLPGSDYPHRDLPPVVQPQVDGKWSTTIPVGQSVRLTGTLLDAGVGTNKITYVWQKIYGPGSVTFANLATPNTTASFSTSGAYGLSLTASNGRLSGRRDVRIVVTAARAGGEFVPGKPGRVISVNIGTALRPEDAAGVLPRANWNGVELKRFPAIIVTRTNLLDDAGTPTTAAYTIKGNNFGAATNFDTPDTADGRMLQGGHGGSAGAEHFIRDIPFPQYDVFLYFRVAAGKEAESADFVHSFLVRDPETDQDLAGPIYARNVAGPFVQWSRASESQFQDRKADTPSGNYLVLPNLSLKSFSVVAGAPDAAWGKKGSSHSSLCGLQIIERQP